MFSHRVTRVSGFFLLLLTMIFGPRTSSSARTMDDDDMQSQRHDPKRTLIRNAAMVITMDPVLGEGPLGILKNAEVLMEGDTITEVGQGLLRGRGAQKWSTPPARS